MKNTARPHHRKRQSVTRSKFSTNSALTCDHPIIHDFRHSFERLLLCKKETAGQAIHSILSIDTRLQFAVTNTMSAGEFGCAVMVSNYSW